MNKNGQHQFSLSSEKTRLGWYEAWCVISARYPPPKHAIDHPVYSERCRRRHIRCQRRAAHLPCNNCKKAKTKCGGGKGDVFRAVHYSSAERGVTTRSRRLSTTAIDRSSSTEATAEGNDHLEDALIVERPEVPDWSNFPEGSFSLNGSLDLQTEQHDPVTGSSYNPSMNNILNETRHPIPFQTTLQVSTPNNRLLESGHAYIGFTRKSRSKTINQTPPPFSTVLSTTSQSSTFWPLKTEFEASLFRHFLVELSPWFDYCDPKNHFRNQVANAAATDKTLLYAIFAVSARHQSSSRNRYLVFAEECQQSCLNSLISALNDYDTTVGENVFASALILRLIEEMTEPQAGSNVTSHALSAQLLIRIKAGNITESTLADAAFLVTLRQEIFISNLTQQPMGSIAEHCNIDTSLSPTSDPMWAYRAIALSAKATDFAYGDEESRTKHQWQGLRKYLDDWESLRPPSFEPIFRESERSSSNPFPSLQFCNDYHVAASQYSELSRILLLASDPSVCKIRIRRLGQGRNHDDAIRESVRLICRVALANRQYMPARSTAGLAISMCGELFHDSTETVLLLELLTDAESHLGWPCLKVKDDLKQLWGLSDNT